MEFFKQNFQLTKFLFPLIFALNILSNSSSQILSGRLENLLRDSSAGFDNQVLVYGFLSFLIALLFPILTMASTLWGIQRHLLNNAITINSFIKKYFEQLVIELLRAWGKILAGFICFIIPGIIAMFTYYLVPFVVCLSRPYDHGQLDALATSKNMMWSHPFKIFFILIFFGLAIPVFLSTVFDGYYTLWKTPTYALILNAIETYFIIFATHLLFTILKDQPELQGEMKPMLKANL